MTAQRDWFSELLERWRREIAAEPYRHSAELRVAIRNWMERQQHEARVLSELDFEEPPDP